MTISTIQYQFRRVDRLNMVHVFPRVGEIKGLDHNVQHSLCGRGLAGTLFVFPTTVSLFRICSQCAVTGVKDGVLHF